MHNYAIIKIFTARKWVNTSVISSSNLGVDILVSVVENQGCRAFFEVLPFFNYIFATIFTDIYII